MDKEDKMSKKNINEYRSDFIKQDGLVLFHDHTTHPDVEKVIDNDVRKKWDCIISGWFCDIIICQRKNRNG